MKNFRNVPQAIALVSAFTLGSVPLARAQESCRNISGHVEGQIIAPDPDCSGPYSETGSFTGDPGGAFRACITNVQQRGDGALVFDLTHIYSLSTGDTFTVADHVVAGPINPPVYRINNRAEITGGTGLYQDAFGFIRDHGTVDLAARVVSVDYQGRICTP
jgi:hypothetical protein